MSVQVNYSASDKLNFVYQPKEVQLHSTIHPMARRFDTFTPPSTQTQQSDIFQVTGVKDFANLRILKKDRFTVTLRDFTVAAVAANEDVATIAPPLNKLNFWLDNFCLSKSINSFKWQCGELILESDQNDRNPWLMEVKSAQFDLDECARWTTSSFY